MTIYRFELDTPTDAALAAYVSGSPTVNARGAALFVDIDAAPADLTDLQEYMTTIGWSYVGASPATTPSQETATDLPAFGSGTKGVVPASGGGTSNFLRADGTWAAPSGGSDPWTYVKLGSDFVTSSATAVNVTGLSFAPSASTVYEVRGQFLLRTATATVGPRPGCSWPTGLTDGVVMFAVTSSATAQVLANGNFNAAVLGPVGGLPNTTQSYPARMEATIIAGGSPSGNFQVQLASETGGTNVTMKANSWIAYRSI